MFRTSTKHSFIALVGGLIGAAIMIAILSLARPGTELSETIVKEVITELKTTLELSEEQVPAVLETANGTLEVASLPTVVEVDGGEIVDPESYARGEYYDVTSPQAFADAVMGRCVIEQNIYGAQCVSLARAFWINYVGRIFSTCGTGAAKGAFNCAIENAGEEFEIITDPYALQAGDWVVFDGGLYGHVGMAMGPANNGFIALLGENQGGRVCDEGGSAANIINISLKNFIGAYRPKIYVQPESPQKLAPDTSEGLLNE